MSRPHVRFDPEDAARITLDPAEPPVIADPLTVFEDQERPLVWIAGPEEDDLWDPIARAWVPRPRLGCLVMACIAAGIVIGLAFGVGIGAGYANAAPRSAQTTESVDMSAPSSAGLIGAPLVVSQTTGPTEDPSAAAAAGDGGGAPITEPAAMEGGLATWCAPTPTRCQSWGGDARLGAVPSFRFGDRPYRVQVCGNGHCTTVTVVSFCGCPGSRIIDLSPAAFTELAPLGVGVLPVTVEDLAGDGVTAPPTDVEP